MRVDANAVQVRKAEAYCLLRRAVAENWTVRVKGSLDGHTPGGMPHRPPTPDSQAESPGRSATHTCAPRPGQSGTGMRRRSTTLKPSNPNPNSDPNPDPYADPTPTPTPDQVDFRPDGEMFVRLEGDIDLKEDGSIWARPHPNPNLNPSPTHTRTRT